MELIILILFLVFIGYAYNISKTLKKSENEIVRLKKEIAKYQEIMQGKTISTIQNSKEYKDFHNINQNLKQEEININQKTKEKHEKEDRQRKNTSILILGAILIVLSAIVFLMSTWNDISSILKTVVILLLSVVFLGASKIAKNRFRLEKASNAFFYIAMAYIPICLISCSFFELAGSYFSIRGEGNFIYLTLVFVITSIIYYCYYRINKSKILFIGMILSQALAITLFSLIFEVNGFIIEINLLIYNLILIFVKNRFKSIDLLRYFYKVIPYFVVLITFCNMGESETLMLIILPLLTLNFYFLKKEKKDNILTSCIYNMLLYSMGMYLFFIYLEILSENLKMIFAIIYIIGIFFIQENLSIENKTSLPVVLIGIGVVFLKSLGNEDIMIKPFMISGIETFLLAIGFMKSKENIKILYKDLMYITVGLTLASIFDILNFNYLWAQLVLTVGISIIEQKYKKISDDFSFYISTIISYLLLLLYNSPISILITFLFSAFFMAENLMNEKNQYLRCIPMVGMLAIVNSIELKQYETYIVLITFLTTIALNLISIYKKEITIDTIFSGIYLLYTLSFFDNEIIAYSFLLIWAFVNMYFMEKEKHKDIFKAVTCSIGFLLSKTIVDKLNISEFKSIYVIVFTVFTIFALRTIGNKYIKSIDNVEYVIFSLINLFAVANYNDGKDGMLFVAFLVILLVYSYARKYGTLFIVSLFSILINSIMLARKFWFSIPWWIYLLVIGTVLIGFAIKNESDEKKDMVNIGSKIKRLKDKVERK